MIRSLRLLMLSAFALALASCSGAGGGLLGNLGNLGNGGGLFNNGASCNPGTDVQIANPTPFQTSVNPNIGQITIVANGNSSSLAQNYQSMNVTLVDSFGNQIPGGALQPADGRTLAHPYNSDFYYQSSIGPLQVNTTYTAELTLVNNLNSFNSCTFTLQQFRT